jgi:hypothetical protein
MNANNTLIIISSRDIIMIHAENFQNSTGSLGCTKKKTGPERNPSKLQAGSKSILTRSKIPQLSDDASKRLKKLVSRNGASKRSSREHWRPNQGQAGMGTTVYIA